MVRKKIDLNILCKNHGIRVMSYSNAKPLLQKNKQLKNLTDKTSACAFYAGDQPVILFDNERPILEVRLMVAHEIGHILFGHLNYRAEEGHHFPDFAEIEANLFAVSVIINDILCEYGQEENDGHEVEGKNVLWAS